MNESKTKGLIQNSILHTSNAFTKKLMEKIEIKKNRAKALRNAIIVACLLCGILLVVITLAPSDFSLLRFQIKLPLLLIKVIGAMFVFIILNKLLSLRAQLI